MKVRDAPRLFHECLNEHRDFVCLGIEREMSSIEDVDLGFRHIFAIAFGLAGIEREIVLTPAESFASTPATSGRHRRWFDNRRKDRFEFRPGSAD